MQPIFPPALKSGDTIAIVAPAGVLDRSRIERAIGRLKQAGFEIKTYGDIYRSRGYLAGDDATRADELRAAFADPAVQAVFPARGGYGATRILDRLDFDIIRKNPKIFTGFSDITALHLAIQRQCGLVTFHSPNPMDGLGMADGLSPFAAHTFWRALRAENYRDADARPLPAGYPLVDAYSRISLEAMRPGKARGRLTGGNLALIAATMGTAYEIETAGRIVFLEDTGERPYRIDRFLSQFRMADKLDSAAGFVLGHFTDCEPNSGEVSLTLDEVFDDFFGSLSIPVVRNFPVGHSAPNATIPMHVLAELDADRGSLVLVENPVAV